MASQIPSETITGPYRTALHCVAATSRLRLSVSSSKYLQELLHCIWGYVGCHRLEGLSGCSEMTMRGSKIPAPTTSRRLGVKTVLYVTHRLQGSGPHPGHPTLTGDACFSDRSSGYTAHTDVNVTLNIRTSYRSSKAGQALSAEALMLRISGSINL
jgi:hypothetical protein